MTVIHHWILHLVFGVNEKFSDEKKFVKIKSINYFYVFQKSIEFIIDVANFI